MTKINYENEGNSGIVMENIEEIRTFLNIIDKRKHDFISNHFKQHNMCIRINREYKVKIYVNFISSNRNKKTCVYEEQFKNLSEIANFIESMY